MEPDAILIWSPVLASDIILLKSFRLFVFVFMLETKYSYSLVFL